MRDPERWRRIDEICGAALDRTGAERSAFVAEACGGDEALREEVEALLARVSTGERFLTASLGSLVAQAVSERVTPLVGRKIGAYAVTAFIGAGGMGEVYRARDTRLGRDVAVKVLPQEFTSHPERLARLEREARILAALNHPGIAAIYGFEEDDEIRALVLELVEGQTLADRIANGPFSFDEAVSLARQIADALDAAHEQGIIHRDLKPANIKLRPDGVVKLLDFGVAKLDARGGADISQLPTVTSEATHVGVLVGTPAYMSPEQALGQAVDKRADIWAFGCILYEMLTGTSAFGRATLHNTIAAVLMHDLKWHTLPSVPPAVRWLLRRCLDRDPTTRLRDIGEARVALSLASADLFASLVDASNAVPTIPVRVLELGETGRARHCAISPDGASVAYVVQDGLWVRRLDRPGGTRIVSAPDVASIAWSPAGDTLAYFQGSEVRTIRIDGSEGRTAWRPTLDQIFREDVGLAWHESGLYVPARGGILRVPLDGGQSEVVAPWDSRSDVVNFRFPLVLDRGKTIVVNPGLYAGRKDFGTVWAFRDGVGRQVLALPETVIIGLSYSPTTRELLFSALDTERVALWAVPFDIERMAAGPPRVVLDGVARPSLPSVDGGLALIGGLRREPSSLRWFDSKGRQIGRVPHGRVDLRNLALSPDGRRVAATASTNNGAAQGLWVYDLNGSLDTQAVPENQYYAWPSWSPDGRVLAFTAAGGNRSSLQIVRIGHTQPPRKLTAGSRGFVTWRPDGRSVIFVRMAGTKQMTEIAEVALDAGSRVKRLGQIPNLVGNVALSPDSRWLAYDSGMRGRTVVTVASFPDLSLRLQVSREEASLPQWSPRGDEVWFVDGNDLVAVPIERDGDGHPSAGRARILLRGSHEIPLVWDFRGTLHRQYATVDGKRFLIPGREIEGESRVTLIEGLPHLLRPVTSR
jgi:serine/threonine protein kinase